MEDVKYFWNRRRTYCVLRVDNCWSNRRYLKIAASTWNILLASFGHLIELRISGKQCKGETCEVVFIFQMKYMKSILQRWHIFGMRFEMEISWDDPHVRSWMLTYDVSERLTKDTGTLLKWTLLAETCCEYRCYILKVGQWSSCWLHKEPSPERRPFIPNAL